MTETVTLALSELRSLITKAARGAGLGWGMAEEAGWAAEWLARRGLPAADWATVWLAARIDGAVCPVETGVMLSDQLAGGTLQDGHGLPDGLVAPGYLLPFVHRIAQGRRSVTITSAFGRVAVVSTEGQVEFGPCWQPQSNGWSLSGRDPVAVVQIPPARPALSKSVLECLEGLALRTTVARSDTSRRDAGSSSGDND